MAYELYVGPIPADKPLVCHHCDKPLCVRPEHLFAGTSSDNYKDAIAKGRAVPWYTNHPVSPEAREKIRASLMGRKLTPEHLAKLKGRTVSPEHRQRCSEAMRGNQHARRKTQSPTHGRK